MSSTPTFRRLSVLITFAVFAFAAAAGRAHAATAEQQCQKGRYSAAARYVGCELKAQAKARGLGDLSDAYNAALAKCSAKYTAKWAKLNAHASGTGSTCDAPRFVVNGNGTVTDALTGFIWERKTDDDTIHDRDNTYAWTAAPFDTAADGAAFTTFLTTLNGVPCFAGQCDWRLPMSIELQTILLAPTPCPTDPCVDQAVFGPDNGGSHWTALAYGDSAAWVVSFSDGYVLGAPKLNANFVRAVRGGL